MFTGIIEQQGQVIANISGDVAHRLLIQTEFEDLQAGESMSINGVCLTLLPDFHKQLAFDVSPETLKRTTLGELRAGDYVNLERAMLASTRFGGHYLSGHVDTTIHLKKVRDVGEYVEMTVGEFEVTDLKYLFPKGSISLDGVSLTINEVLDRCIKVLLVPHTLSKTTLGKRLKQERLNVEFDYLARIVVHQLNSLMMGILHTRG